MTTKTIEFGAELGNEAMSLLEFLDDVRDFCIREGETLSSVRIESDMPQGETATYATLWRERLTDGSHVFDVRLTNA